MKKPKILIVEDEVIVALEVKTEVEKLNCEVTDIVYTKENLLKSIEKSVPDLILMDIKLGKNEDGIHLAQEILKTKTISILYLTAYSDDTTMTRAFSTNPIGYIVKPFKPQDLKTNIQLSLYKLKLLPSKNIDKNHHYLGEGFYFDTIKENLYYYDNFINLGVKEKQLLSMLIDANYSKVQFSYIEDVIWHGHRPSKSALRTLVYRLKGKLGKDIIEVTYGYGYNLKKPS